MHITDGVLHPAVLVGGYALGGALAAWGARRMAPEDYPRVGLLTAGFFVAGLLRIPLAQTSVHLILSGLMGAALGRRCLPALFVGLLLQALLLAHGGVSAVGVNLLIMGLPACLAGGVFRWSLRRVPGAADGAVAAAGFACGSLAIVGSGMLLFVTLAFLPLQANAVRDAYRVLAWAALALHVPVMLIEGVLTAFIATAVRRAAPEFLNLPPPMGSVAAETATMEAGHVR